MLRFSALKSVHVINSSIRSRTCQALISFFRSFVHVHLCVVKKQHAGRPAQGSIKDDGQERIRDYPKLAITVRPDTRAKLNAVAAVEQRSSWKIVDDAINQYVSRLSPSDRKMVDTIAARAKSRR
jgi:hypothetical protein